MKSETGLLGRIKNATSESQIKVLLNEGKNYKLAADGARRKWAKAAESRIEELKRERDAAYDRTEPPAK